VRYRALKHGARLEEELFQLTFHELKTDTELKYETSCDFSFIGLFFYPMKTKKPRRIRYAMYNKICAN